MKHNKNAAVCQLWIRDLRLNAAMEFTNSYQKDSERSESPRRETGCIAAAERCADDFGISLRRAEQGCIWRRLLVIFSEIPDGVNDVQRLREKRL